MSVLTIVLTVIQLLAGLAVSAIVLLQSGKSAGLSGTISGGADALLSNKGKNKGRDWDADLAKATPIFAAVFVVLTMVLNLCIKAGL